MKPITNANVPLQPQPASDAHDAHFTKSDCNKFFQCLKNLQEEFTVTHSPTTVGIIASGGITHANPPRLIVAQTVCVTGTYLVALPYCSVILFAGFTTCRIIGDPANYTQLKKVKKVLYSR